MINEELCDLLEMSHKYGSDAEFVLAGGGNTSYKNAEYLYVKGSGSSLATIKPEQFVKMERSALDSMWSKEYSQVEAEREAQVLEDMMDARCKGEYTKRPSVETLLHNLFCQTLVLHVHPAKVNGITCAVDGEKAAAELFPEAVWVPSSKPGYILAAYCKKAIADYKAKTGKCPSVLFLQNHGIFFAANTYDEMQTLVASVMEKIDSAIKRTPDFSDVEIDKVKASYIAPAIRMLYSENGDVCVSFNANKEILSFASSKEAFEPLYKSYSPDHIVYCKAFVLYIDEYETIDETYDALKAGFEKWQSEFGYLPKVIFVKGIGMFSVGTTKKNADTAAEVFTDMMKIAVYAESFGGYLPMSDELIAFITNWEVESYRAKVSLGAAGTKRLEGKITIVTGSAQGFGKGIAEEMIAQGAYVAIADLNYDGAKACADEMCEKYGKNVAFPVAVNVADEASVEQMITETVLMYGGLDIMVANAGIAIAGNLEEMQLKRFELVTNVNYTGYFLCTKYSTRIMKIQHKFAPKYMMDVIGVNSKSGLEGSNKNFAYAGSKFGGIGLTQSFALELVEFNIKCNCVCPGNYLDGPLWSDPVKGLFVQYLNAGKVPGAKNVDDVRKFYEAKVPMKRGCLPVDVARAISYIVEQKYETGQALPVAGGQVMLN